MEDRALDWVGTYNARDLGGLSTVGGGETARGAIVRSDLLQNLEARGWEEVEAYGTRTVIDLRNETEIGADAAPRPGSVETVNIPLDVTEARDFWEVWWNGPQFATPLYYGPHLERFPERSAEVIGRGCACSTSHAAKRTRPRRSPSICAGKERAPPT
jgi:protein-tyrosine phosphatase